MNMAEFSKEVAPEESDNPKPPKRIAGNITTISLYLNQCVVQKLFLLPYETSKFNTLF